MSGAQVSFGLKAAEAWGSDPGNRRARLYSASGRAHEARHALRQAIAWRYLSASEAGAAMRLVERIAAVLWRMTRR